jgi:hypothetical protein
VFGAVVDSEFVEPDYSDGTWPAHRVPSDDGWSPYWWPARLSRPPFSPESIRMWFSGHSPDEGDDQWPQA